MMRYWLLIIFSAILYALPFTLINSCWWIIAFFLIPLFYLAFKQQLTFFKSLCWGFLAITLHNIGEFYSSLVQIESSIFLGILIITVTNLYFAFHAAVIFTLASWISRLCTTQVPALNRLIQLIVWSCAFTLFFIFMSSYCFWIFIRPEGNPVTHPLVPLALHPALLMLVPLLGKQIVVFLLIIWQGILTLMIVQPCVSLAIIWSIITSTWLASTFFAQQEIPPTWLSRIGYLPRSIEQKLSVSYSARMLRCYITSILNADPEIDIILVPEDGFQSSNLNLPQVCTQFDLQNITSNHIQLIIGAYRKEKEFSYNTLYWISDGHLLRYFDKTHTMILTEKTPPIFGFNLFKKLDQGKIPLSTGTNARPIFDLDLDIKLIPYICSEFYLHDEPDDNFTNETILAICSEKWIQLSCIKDRLFLLARLQALAWQRNILYITYHFGVFITKHGNIFVLKDFSKELALCDDNIKIERESRDEYENISTKKYDQLSSYDAFALPKINMELHASLLMPSPETCAGISFCPTTPLTHHHDEIKVLISHEKKNTHEKLIHAYLALNDIQIFYIDSLTLDVSTNHLIANIFPRGTVALTDPTSNRAIIVSRYR